MFFSRAYLLESAFAITANVSGYGKCGILKPNLCPPDRMLFSCNILIFKQSARICYSRCCAFVLFNLFPLFHLLSVK